MSRRKTVELNLGFVLPKIKEVCRSNVVFCEKMGRKKQPTWVSDWSRKTACKNLPSPEEAAHMCAILGTEPEQILVTQEDIDLVKSLIEAEKPTSFLEDGLSAELQEIIALYKAASPEVRAAMLAMLRAAEAQSKALDGGKANK